MKMKHRSLVVGLSIIFAICIIVASYGFTQDVQNQLWQKSVTDILEITVQGSRALDTYIEKDYDTLHLFTTEMTELSSTNQAAIDQVIGLFDEEETSFYCSDLKKGSTYSDLNEKIPLMKQSQKEKLLDLQESGLRELFYDAYTGVRTIGVYERFLFADGVEGLAQKTRSVQSITDQFSLSFYNNNGFSYVINQDGQVMVRSLHKDSNRTFQNIFDIISLKNDDEAALDHLKDQLAERATGVFQFQYQDTDYVFCYVPMEAETNWYVVSLIPNHIIMQQADRIIYKTIGLCALIMVCLAIIGIAHRQSMKKQQKQIETLAFYDPLTGLYRYEKFLEEGNQLLLGTKKLAALYIDVIGFKLLNDVEGYHYGDEVLKALADTLKQNSQGNDISCRVSGDDFILLAHYQVKHDIDHLCQRIGAAMQQSIDQTHNIKIKIGVCLLDGVDGEVGMNALIDRSRMAQKSIKEDPQIAYQFYDQKMRQELLHDAELEQLMEQALQNEEFIYVIQPKYSLDGSKIMGGEALVRWRRSATTFISPGDFVPLFEKNGFIRKLDEYVFTKVCETLQARIHKKEAVVPISVNVSRVHFYWHDFADIYIAIKEQYDIPDQLIELELTEGILFKNIEETCVVLNKLREHGFRFSIDDFGSGYSSLNILKELPVDVVKMDCVFFDLKDHVDKNKIILRSIIAMAKQLSLQVVAEGIENQEQLAMLERTGCDMVQGFLYARPCMVEEFYALLEENQLD